MARRSVGFGDRLGLATPGHLTAARRFNFAPVFAQQSVREMERTERSPADVLRSATDALATAGFKGQWGAEITHLRTETDINRAAAAGFSRFAVDPSSFLENRADRLAPDQLEESAAQIAKEGLLDGNWTARYLTQPLELPGGTVIHFEREPLLRAGVKFAAAIAHAQRLARALARRVPQDTAAVELDLRGTVAPTSLLDHAFVASEAKRRNIPLTAIAPAWSAGFEPAMDFRGDGAAFEELLRGHAAIAAHFGPYAISVPEASDKLSLLPLLARTCGDWLRVKTSGVTYLEALRLVCRVAPDAFREIAGYARMRFDADRGLTRVTTTPADLDRLFQSAKRASLEHAFFETAAGRQMLHVTYGSVLGGGVTAKGRPFKELIQETVASEAATYHDQLDALFTRHLTLLNRG